VPLAVLQKSKPNNQTYTCGESQAPNYPIDAPGRKRLISAQCCRSQFNLSFSGKVTLLACTFYDGLAAIQSIRIIIIIENDMHCIVNVYKYTESKRNGFLPEEYTYNLNCIIWTCIWLYIDMIMTILSNHMEITAAVTWCFHDHLSIFIIISFILLYMFMYKLYLLNTDTTFLS
jgi:hypothetical protein